MEITSPSNPRVVQAARLRQAKGRRQQQRIIIDGVRELNRAVDAGVKLDELFVVENSPAIDELLERVGDSAHVLHVSPRAFEKVAFGDRNEGIVGVAEHPRPTLESLEADSLNTIAVIEGVEKPGNLGGILRTADAAGVSAVLVADPVCDVYNPNAIRASLGALFTTPTIAVTSEEAHAWLSEHEFRMFTARVDAQLSYSDSVYSGSKIAIVLGSEAHGLQSPVWRDNVTSVRIPMAGAVDSLNVSVAAAILLFEVKRQRTSEGRPD